MAATLRGSSNNKQKAQKVLLAIALAEKFEIWISPALVFSPRLDCGCSSSQTFQRELGAYSNIPVFSRAQVKRAFCKRLPSHTKLALGSTGCLFGWLFVTLPKMAKYTEISCWPRPVQSSTAKQGQVQPNTVHYRQVQPSTGQYSTEKSTKVHHRQCRWKYTTIYTSLHCPDSLLHSSTLVLF